MSLPAARLFDTDVCPVHGPAQIGQAADNVRADSRPIARAADKCVCPAGPRDAISTGSGTVRVNGRPVAHFGSKTTHGGTLLTGSPSVFIGGPDVTVVGPVGDGTASCAAAAATRDPPGKKTQSKGNCGLETMRQMLNAKRAREGLPPITEKEMLDKGIAAGACNDPKEPWAIGAANGPVQVAIMNGEGLPAYWALGTPENIKAVLATGQPVGAQVRPHEYSPRFPNPKSQHEVLVTGVECDDKGNILAYIINDTGLGICGMSVPASKFDAARKGLNGSQQQILIPKERVY